jgi:crotonobetainyl-CoA:carnitine CoA-transferase CaiB-like acyl-CoA transferase
MTLPLADMRVISIEQFGAGPWATLQLADLGAEVIKIEDPTTGGDVGRYVPPYQVGTDSLFFETFNRNKKSLSLDLRTDDGRQVLHDLVREADLVCSNLRGDLPKRLGLTYDDLKDVNPTIVCCSLSGFGMTGPRAGEAAYDYLVQGIAGWMSLTGAPEGAPTKSGLSLVDLSGGYVAAIAALAAIHRARRDGVGCDCDISLFETALAELMYVGTWVASRDYVPPRWENSAHPSLVPFQNFRSADGWVVVGCAKEKFWRRLCRAVGRPGLASDPRFVTFADRDRHRGELLPILDAAFLARTTREWIDTLSEANVPVAPVNDVAAAFADPQTIAREDLVEFEHPTLGTVRQVATPLRVGTEPKPVSRAPFLGEHTDEVLGSVCSYPAERIEGLLARHVITQHGWRGADGNGDGSPADAQVGTLGVPDPPAAR